MKKISLGLEIIEVEDITTLSSEDQGLIEDAKSMTYQAYAPYSEFFVGAAILMENGKIVKGSNQENAAYPSGLCAERVAIFSASSLYPNVPVKSIAISARNSRKKLDYPVSPCGACRQVLLEYEFKQKKPFKIFLSGESGSIYIIDKAQDLMPLSFTADDLAKF